MIELFDFIKHIITPDALVPFMFVLIIVLIKYVIIPWDKMLKQTIENTTQSRELDNEQFKAVLDKIDSVKKDIYSRGSGCDLTMKEHITSTKKILDKLESIENSVENIVSRLEKVKDDAKDGKLDFNQQLFSIKQEISDLKSKIEPLVFMSRGIK